jgi:hypothetical protein
MTRIVASAILQDGKVWTGKRHHNCIREIVDKTGIRPVTGQQGFVTDESKFLSREEAMSLAIENGQVVEGKTHHKRELFSEDLW